MSFGSFFVLSNHFNRSPPSFEKRCLRLNRSITSFSLSLEVKKEQSNRHAEAKSICWQGRLVIFICGDALLMGEKNTLYGWYFNINFDILIKHFSIVKWIRLADIILRFCGFGGHQFLNQTRIDKDSSTTIKPKSRLTSAKAGYLYNYTTAVR